jgi:hypothetical protein
VLDRWDAIADLHSQPLRDEWRRIINGQLWALAIEDSDQGQQLRQSSPLGFVLEPAVRDSILRAWHRARGSQEQMVDPDLDRTDHDRVIEGLKDVAAGLVLTDEEADELLGLTRQQPPKDTARPG